MTKTKIGVLGAGTWGTALARMLAGNGCDVTMWSALPDELKAMSVTHAHPNLPGMCLPADMHYTADIEEICGDRDVLLFAVCAFHRPQGGTAYPGWAADRGCGQRRGGKNADDDVRNH